MGDPPDLNLMGYLDSSTARLNSGLGLANLKDLKSLSRLFLTETKVDDSGMVQLRELKTLELLGLSGTKIGDPALVQLQELVGLKQLFCIGTGVTGTGVEKLQKALPNCRVVH